MNDIELHRVVGKIEGEMSALRRDVTEMRAQLSSVLASNNRARGAAFIGGTFLSAVVSFATAWFTK